MVVNFITCRKVCYGFGFLTMFIEEEAAGNMQKNDIKAQWNFYKMGFTSFSEFLTNAIIRGIVRLVPNSLRVFTYKYLLRKKI